MRRGWRDLGTWVMLLLIAGPALGADWPGWRGPGRDGRVSDFQAPEPWPDTLTRRWSLEVGSGHSSPVIADGWVYLLSREGDEESVRAVDLETGEVQWKKTYPVAFKPGMGSGRHGRGPKSTPMVAGDRLITLGISGILSAWNARSGELAWRRESAAEFKKAAPQFGAAMSPLVTPELVVAHLGGKGEGSLMALAATDGEERWSWPGEGPAYASPILVEVAGVRQIVTQTQDSIVSLALDGGTVLWQAPFPSSLTSQNAVTPLQVGEDTLVLSGKKRGIWAVQPRLEDGSWTLREVWRNDDVSLYLSSPVVEGNRIFGLSHLKKGQLFAMDVAGGKVLWSTEGRSAENAALLSAPGLVFVLTAEGDLRVLDATAEDMKQLATYDLSDGQIWAHPAISGDKVVIKDAGTLSLWTFAGEVP